MRTIFFSTAPFPFLRGRAIPIALALLFTAGSAFAQGRPAPTFSFSVDPSTVTAGRTLLLRIETSAPFKKAFVAFKGRRAEFYPSAENQGRALLGMQALESTGVKRGQIHVEFLSGKSGQAPVDFHIEPGDYPIGHVKLSAARMSLLTSGQMEKDARALDRVYRMPAAREKLWSGVFVMPTTGVVSSVFGARRRYGTGQLQQPHTGMDIANKTGTDIRAPNRGRVVFNARLASFGQSVILDHGQGVYSYYLHMTESAVTEGDLLEPGALIGKMGAEGVATGPHLHWSFVVSGTRVDPREWLEREFP